MKAYSYLFAIVCLNVAAASLAAMGVFQVGIQYEWQIDDVTTWFSLDIFDIVLAVGGSALLGVIVSMFKTYTFAAGAIVLWVIAILVKPLNIVVTGFPTMLNNIFLSVAPGLTWFSAVVGLFVTLAFFMLFLEIASGKQIL